MAHRKPAKLLTKPNGLLDPWPVLVRKRGCYLEVPQTFERCTRSLSPMG